MQPSSATYSIVQVKKLKTMPWESVVCFTRLCISGILYRVHTPHIFFYLYECTIGFMFQLLMWMGHRVLSLFVHLYASICPAWLRYIFQTWDTFSANLVKALLEYNQCNFKTSTKLPYVLPRREGFFGNIWIVYFMPRFLLNWNYQWTHDQRDLK